MVLETSKKKHHLMVRALQPAKISTPSSVLTAAASKAAVAIICHAEGSCASKHLLSALRLECVFFIECVYIYDARNV